MPRHVVAPVADIPPGGRKRVEVNGRAVVVFNIAGEYFALSDRCPHRGGPLSQGRLTGLLESAEPGAYRYTRLGEILRCPWHGWEYDIETGEYAGDRRKRLRRYETIQKEDRIYVRA